jgi:hypothetical protein
MTKNFDTSEDFIITIKPEATPEEVKQFTEQLARVILAIARHVVTLQDRPSGEAEDTIAF